jgi:hypothetical protein
LRHRLTLIQKYYYKYEFDKKGRSVACHLNGKLKKRVEKDFERTNQLHKVEKQEWSGLMNEATRGDKEKKK